MRQTKTKNDSLVGKQVKLTEQVYHLKKGSIVTIASVNTVDDTLVYVKSTFFVPMHTHQFEVL